MKAPQNSLNFANISTTTKVIAYQSQQFLSLFQNSAAINKPIQRVASMAPLQMKNQVFLLPFSYFWRYCYQIWYANVKWPFLSTSDLGISVSPLLKSQFKEDSKLKNCVQILSMAPLQMKNQVFLLPFSYFWRYCYQIWYANVKWPFLSTSDLGISVSPLLKSQFKEDSKLKNCVQKFDFYSPLMHSNRVLCFMRINHSKYHTFYY